MDNGLLLFVNSQKSFLVTNFCFFFFAIFILIYVIRR